MAQSDINVGMGIALSGKPTAPGKVFAAGVQERRYQQAAAAKADDELKQIKNKILLDKNKYHPLVANEVIDKTSKVLRDLALVKAEHPTDYMSQAYALLGEWQKEVSLGYDRSQSLYDFEKINKSDTSKVYIPANMQAAYQEMSRHQTVDEWMNALQAKGIQQNKYFAYDPVTKDIAFSVGAQMDPEQFAKSVFKQHSGDILDVREGTEKTAKGEAIRTVTTVTGIPRTEQEATSIASGLYARTGRMGQQVYSGEQMAKTYFSDPEAMAQYQDRYPETVGMDETALVEDFLKRFYDPYAPKKENVVKYDKSGMQINISAGPPEAIARFQMTDTKGTIAGSTVPYDGKATWQAGGKFKVNAITSEKILTGTGVRDAELDRVTALESFKIQEISIGDSYVIPVIVQNGKVTAATKEQVAAKNPNIEYQVYTSGSFSTNQLTPELNYLSNKTFLFPLIDVQSALVSQSLTDKQYEALKNGMENAKAIAQKKTQQYKASIR